MFAAKEYNAFHFLLRYTQNTFEYTEALVQADKDFKMNIYTNRNHSIYGGNTRKHLLRQIADFFIENMK